MNEIKCGLEIHGYINVKNKTKLFCDCAIDENAEPNTNTCPICTGQPGCKPMLPNKEAIEKIVAIALMLNCKINKELLFQRKHYSWPDLPNGFQKTMSGSYAVPVGEHGEFKGINITEIHLEEDPARWDPKTGCVDYNRSGLPLVEIVTEPEFTSSKQVKEWLKELIKELSYIKAIDKKAGIKSDVNVSIPPDYERVEIKNVNSIKSIVNAMEYEAYRQKQEKTEGKKIPQQTRTWDNAKGATLFMRTKETAEGYMFIPEPDLPNIPISEEFIRKIEKGLPKKRLDMIEKIKNSMNKDAAKTAEILSRNPILGNLYAQAVKKVHTDIAATWIRRELLRVLNYNKLEPDTLSESFKEQFINLLVTVDKKHITETTAQKILEKLVVNPFDVNQYIKENKLGVADIRSLEIICKKVVQQNPAAVVEYKKGNPKSFNFLVGQVMRQTKGTASPKEVNDILKKLIN